MTASGEKSFNISEHLNRLNQFICSHQKLAQNRSSSSVALRGVECELAMHWQDTECTKYKLRESS